MENVLKDLDFLQKVAPLGKIFETNLKDQGAMQSCAHHFFQKGACSSYFPGGGHLPLPLPISHLWQ